MCSITKVVGGIFSAMAAIYMPSGYLLVIHEAHAEHKVTHAENKEKINHNRIAIKVAVGITAKVIKKTMFPATVSILPPIFLGYSGHVSRQQK
jgi:hypothetical protein